MHPLRVLNTRPQDRAQPLSDCLTQHGFVVINLPLLGFERCTEQVEDRHKYQPAQPYDVVIVVSPIAAEYGLQTLQQQQQSLSAYAKHWIAVGQATAGVLAQAGIHAQVPQLENSEGVLALPRLQLPKGARVLVWRGHGGRELIQRTLFDQGVQVETLELYRRHLPKSSVQTWQDLSTKPDVVLLSSGEAWRNWQQLAGAFANNPVLLVYGERLVELLTSQAQVIALASLQPEQVLQALLGVRRLSQEV